jgi:hypothetical protein
VQQAKQKNDWQFSTALSGKEPAEKFPYTSIDMTKNQQKQ